MKKLILLLTALCTTLLANAQYKVQFIVKEQTAIHHDSIYITGSFNNWDSTANKNYLMRPYGKDEKSIVLNLKAGTYEYKFTRGNWFTVEEKYDGEEVPNRVANISNDTTIMDTVRAWRDLMIANKKYALTQAKSDTDRISILSVISYIYAYNPEWYNVDSALLYAQKALDLTQKIKSSGEYKTWSKTNYFGSLLFSQFRMARLFRSLGNYSKSLELYFEALKLAGKEKNKFFTVIVMEQIVNDYAAMKDYQEVLHYGKLMDSIVSNMNTHQSNFKVAACWAKNNISSAYYHLHLLDSALYYAGEMKAVNMKDTDFVAKGNLLLANIYSQKGDDSAAFHLYKQITNGGILTAMANEGIARLFQNEHKVDSALYYARLSLSYFQNNKLNIKAWMGQNSDTYIAAIAPLIAELYKSNHQLDSAYKYLNLSVLLKDSLYNVDKIRQFQTLTFNEAAQQRQLERQKEEAHQHLMNELKMYFLIFIIIIILIVAFLLFRNNRNKQKANVILNKQKEEIQTALSNLKSTQKQLIQSEKMASLGELTAGIAHEIQNPLNFVNNFSEVNTELLAEMNTEIDKGNLNEVKVIAHDITENSEKIIHHGKRADAIVKGMLQHSRISSGKKEPTNINALADEYFRLSYHGMRAKDKGFNATMKTDFDESIGKINVVPQDIGRVLLNLFNNAFYACAERSRSSTGSDTGSSTDAERSRSAISTSLDDQNSTSLDDHYEPTVWVSTKRVVDVIPPLGGTRGAGASFVEIRVRDNGNGIPDKIKDKIFQPFFTTKPTGEGTGLGLSLSYDMIKAHGGEITVNSKEGEGTEFIVILPDNKPPLGVGG